MLLGRPGIPFARPFDLEKTVEGRLDVAGRPLLYADKPLTSVPVAVEHRPALAVGHAQGKPTREPPPAIASH